MLFGLEDTGFYRKPAVHSQPEPLAPSLMEEENRMEILLTPASESEKKMEIKTEDEVPHPIKTLDDLVIAPRPKYWQTIKLFHFIENTPSIWRQLVDPFRVATFVPLVWVGFVYGMSIAWVALLTDTQGKQTSTFTHLS